MKKLTLLMVVLFLFASVFAVVAEETEATLEERVAALEADKSQGLVVSGSVEISFGDDDIAAEPSGAFASAKTGVIASLKAMSANETVEAGITLDLTPTITMTAGDSATDLTDLDGDEKAYSYYDGLADIMAWYDGHVDSYDADYGVTLPAIVWNSNDSGNDWIEDGTNDLNDAPTTWTAALFDDLVAVYGAVVADIETNLDALSATTDPEGNGDYIDQFGRFINGATGAVVAASPTAAQKDAHNGEAAAWNDYLAVKVGSASDDTWAASYPVKNAYLKINAIGGVLDVMFEVNGKAIAVGSMVTSDASVADDANVGFTAALSSGVVEGVSASALVTAGGGAAAVTEDWETRADNTAGSDPTVWGAKLCAGYATDMFGISGAVAFEDISDTAGLMWSVMPSLTMTDLYGLAVSGEVNGVADAGLGAGAKVSAAVMGIKPAIGFYYKNAAFGGAGDSNLDGSDAITTDSGLMAQFNSIDDADAMALAIDVSADLTELMGMKLLTIGGGFDMMLEAEGNYGWDATLGLDLAEVLAAPVTAGFSISQWAAEDLVWAANLGYTFAETMAVSAVFEQPEAEVLSYTVKATVKF
jgi:hypothetical protein